jgi:replicative DNA helicase
VGTINRAIDKLVDFSDMRRKEPSSVWGMSTGYPSIDKVTGGLHNGEVSVLAARTSHGKTALATKIAFNVADDVLMESVQAGHTTGQVLIFSPEMTSEQLIMRQACMIAEIPSLGINDGTASKEDYEAFLEALEMLRNLDEVVYLKATGSVDVNDLVQTVEQRNSAGPPVKLVLVDYLQRLRVDSIRSSYDKASAISFAIKDMANREHVPVLLLSQLNRDVEKRKKGGDADDVFPELSDMRDSGRIEEDADSVWLLYRPNKLTGQIEDSLAQQGILSIAKNRNGRVAAMPLWFYPNLALFVDAGLDKIEVDGGT